MSKVGIPIAIIAGALIGVGGYFAASKMSAPKPDSSAKTELDQLRKGMADLQAKMAKLQAEPRLDQAIQDPVFREQLANIVTETRTPGSYRPRPTARGSAAWRREAAQRYRRDYLQILIDMKRRMRMSEDEYKKALPILKEHFKPVESLLAKYEQGMTRTSPRVNELVAPKLPETLGKLKKVLRPGTVKAFDTWRRDTKTITSWRNSKGDYFLDGDEHKDFLVKKGERLNWPVLRQDLEKFYWKATVAKDKRSRVEAILREHLTNVFTAIRDIKHPVLYRPPASTKVKEVTKNTEAELAKVLGADGVSKFKEWKKSYMRSSFYFGELPRGRPPAPVTGPASRRPGTRPAPSKGDKF